MATPIRLKGITRAEIIEQIKANAIDGVLTVKEISFNVSEDTTVYVKYRKVSGFLMAHESNFGGLYINNSHDLKDSADQFRDVKYLAEVFGVDLIEGKTVARDDTPVFDDRDLTIAKLEAQVQVYKTMMPSMDNVTYKKDGGLR
jgi:hypothetical protein